MLRITHIYFKNNHISAHTPVRVSKLTRTVECPILQNIRVIVSQNFILIIRLLILCHREEKKISTHQETEKMLSVQCTSNSLLDVSHTESIVEDVHNLNYTTQDDSSTWLHVDIHLIRHLV